jgi:4-hydroxy-4-methyl-2-oxoglutarate aldolase
VTPFQANVPVVLRGVGVIPGAYVYADSSGTVVIPAGDVEQVLAVARSIETDDARYRGDRPGERPAALGDYGPSETSLQQERTIR